MTRTNLFHRMPGVWEEGAFYDAVWGQIRRQLERGGALNKSERRVLAALLDRVAASPEARKALGIKLRPHTAARNDRIADMFIRLRDYEGGTRESAEIAVRRAFPAVRDRALRDIVRSNKWLGPARARQLAAHLLQHNLGDTPAPIFLKPPARKR